MVGARNMATATNVFRPRIMSAARNVAIAGNMTSP
jgi:hypothetical protein